MATFFALLGHRNRPIEAIFAATDAAEENRERECAAATKIQSAARMRRNRIRYVILRNSVIHIQRLYRAYRGRMRYLGRALDIATKERDDIYHYFATAIQARFRGYISRKWISDFYSQKAYIKQVEERSAEVRAAGDRLREEQLRVTEAKAQSDHAASFASATKNLHHLLSTASCSGVFRPPQTGDIGIRTVFNTNIEDELRSVSIPRRKFKPDLPTSTRGSSMRGTSTFKGATFGGTESLGPALQTSCAYDAAGESEKVDRRVNKTLMESIHGGVKFTAKKPAPPGYIMSVTRGTPYNGENPVVKQRFLKSK